MCFCVAQFTADWNVSLGEVISATSGFENSAIHYENSDGWLRFAFASPVNVTAGETGALMSFDISGTNINPGDLEIMLSEALMFSN